MAHFRHTPHISEIEAQIKWEMAGVERGVLRAREMILSQNLGDGEIGTKVMRRCLPPLIDLIRKAQAEASAGIDEARPRSSEYRPVAVVARGDQRTGFRYRRLQR